MNGLADLDETLVAEADRIEDLLAYHRNQVRCPVYTSVDIRRNDHKAAVVDANAFPAGFNNLAKRSHQVASEAISGYMERIYPEARSVLVLAENHTRNAWYFENLRVLGGLFEAAGFTVRLGTMNEELWPSAELDTATGASIRLDAVLREGDDLIVGGHVPDVVILNNDLSAGSPAILDGLAQPVTPPPLMGWHRRRKSEHFRIVAELARQLGAYVGLDPWQITAEFEVVDDVDFRSRQGIEEVAAHVDAVLARVQAQYDAHGIKEQPNVFVKADAGTYGMGVMTADSGQAFLKLNSKARERMDRGKEKVKTTRVIIQEGVPTRMRSQSGVAEPVMYMVCGRVVGGFNRVHGTKGSKDNLNAPGSTFEPLSFVTHGPGEPGPDETRLGPISAHVYQVLGEIASIATGYECRLATEPDAGIPSYP